MTNAYALLRRPHGFTLIEILVVIVILGILAALIVPRVMDRPDQARATAARADIAAIIGALKLYKLDNGTYPSTDQGLAALVKKPERGDIPRNWKAGGSCAAPGIWCARKASTSRCSCGRSARRRSCRGGCSPSEPGASPTASCVWSATAASRSQAATSCSVPSACRRAS